MRRNCGPIWTPSGPARILPVFFEHLTASPQTELERVCSFIGYTGQPVWQTDFSRQNASQQRLRHTPMLSFLKNFPGSQTLRRALLPEGFRERLKSRWRIEERPALTPEIRLQLQGLFDEDLAQLGAWLGLDLDCASFEATARDAMPDWSADALMRFSHVG